MKWSAYTFKTYLHLNETTYSKSLCVLFIFTDMTSTGSILFQVNYCLALVSVYLLYCTVSSCIKASFCPIVDINECSALPSVCDVNTNCQNKVGSYLCKPGFVGNEKTCQGICKFYFKLHEAFTVTLQVVYYLKSTKIFDNEQGNRKCRTFRPYEKGIDVRLLSWRGLS